MKLPASFGKYYLLERIALGGMAEIYLAKAFGFGGFERLLVIKKILPHIVEDQEFISMFIDEARIASTLSHSNIAQITELGKVGHSHFIAMEFVHGKDLSKIFDRLRKNKCTLPIPLAGFIASRICEGLEYAHRQTDSTGRNLKIVHRDVSPGNVLVGYDGEVKLIDFGIAKAQNRMGGTAAGTLKGKFGYMSPEQARGLPLDHRSDIFSAGILLYELLTGERLFTGEDNLGTLEKVRNAVVKPPTSCNNKIPKELDAVVLRALARDLEERYVWASDLQQDLATFLTQDAALINTKNLSDFMHELFANELAEENENLGIYRKRGYPRKNTALAHRDAHATASENDTNLAPELRQEMQGPSDSDLGLRLPIDRAKPARGALGIALAFFGGLCVAILLGYFLIVYPKLSHTSHGIKPSPELLEDPGEPPSAPAAKTSTEPDPNLLTKSADAASQKTTGNGEPPKTNRAAIGSSISVKSTPPGAEILLNGKNLGKTPKTIDGLDPTKSYFLVLKKTAFKSFYQGVKFEGKKHLVVTAVLLPTKANLNAASAQTAGYSSGAKVGFLVANTNPWAQVIVDGQDTGRWTPIPEKNNLVLPAGKHEVTFKTKDGKILKVPVTIQAGKTDKLILTIP